VIAPKALDPTLNRLWLRVPAEADEHVWGGGEQFSYFDLRGRHFPLWSSEPGVGRDPEATLFQQVEALAKGGGGTSAHTNYPQPTFISSRRYALHIDSYAYAAFDFRDDCLPRGRGLGDSGPDRTVGAPALCGHSNRAGGSRQAAALARMALQGRGDRAEGRRGKFHAAQAL
jgi:hypothetical protein